MTMSPTPRRDELHDGKPAWAARLHDLKREFLQAVKSSRLQIVLVQSANGQDVRHLQPTADDRSRFAIARQNVSLPDGTPAWRFTYEIGKPNDPAKRLMERGDDILKAHGQEIFGLFGVPFIDSRKNWAWLLWQLKSIDHPYQGDIEAESTLAGVLPPNESQQVAAWTFGCGPKPDWYAERSRSFRVDLPHVTAASIAAIRAILARVGSAPRSASNAASKTSPEQPRETIASEVKPPKPKRKRRLSGQAKPLTRRQAEALKLHGECEGNIAEVVREIRATGISLRDAALLVTDGDEKAAKITIRRWHNSRSPELPPSIGFDLLHKQKKLYPPSAILKFAQIVEGFSDVDFSGHLAALNAKARCPRPVAKPSEPSAR